MTLSCGEVEGCGVRGEDFLRDTPRVPSERLAFGARIRENSYKAAKWNSAIVMGSYSVRDIRMTVCLIHPRVISPSLKETLGFLFGILGVNSDYIYTDRIIKIWNLKVRDFNGITSKISIQRQGLAIKNGCTKGSVGFAYRLRGPLATWTIDSRTPTREKSG